jgi:phosphosulfolactate synthase
MIMKDFLTLPPRSQKPRETGISLVMDKGTGLRDIEDLLASASDYIDIVKLGWGTGYVTQNLRDKVSLYQQAGIPVYLGGTLLELSSTGRWRSPSA